LLLIEFINAYEENKGRLLYKQFDVMLHEEVLNEFINYFQKNIDHLTTELLEKIQSAIEL
jgi:hypothetical protein